MKRDEDGEAAKSDPAGKSGGTDLRTKGGAPLAFGEKRVFIRSGETMRYMRVSRRAQVAMTLSCAALVGWSVFATASLMVSRMEHDAALDRVASLRTGYETRIAALSRRGDAIERKLTASEDRVSALSRELADNQRRIADSDLAERELSISVATLREKLRSAVTRRDAALRAAEAMRQGLEQAQDRLSHVKSSEEEWTVTIAAVSDALSDAVDARDAALSTTEELSAELETLQDERRREEERRGQMYSQLEDAVRIGMGSMERVFSRAGLDVDGLVSSVRREYDGSGGPFIPVTQVAGGEAASSDAARVAALITGLEKLNLMQVAAAKLPFAGPVRAAFRFTSGFGVRSDPVNGRARMHAGVDFASAIGTPIYTTADGVVTYAGWQSGYGRVVKVQHGFGFETVYGHLSKIRVSKGDRVAQGDRIGDMGNSGRVTGVHLHYEIRRGGVPVNPLKYIEAARNVL